VVAAPELVGVVDVANVLGEGLVWNVERQSAWWTDIESAKLLEYEPGTGALRTWDTPHRVACFGFVANDDRLIVAFDRGIAYFDPQTGATEWLVGPKEHADGLRFNDGKVDPAGRFWVGTMIEDPETANTSGALYSLDSGIDLTEHIGDIGISNGLCWSPDGSVMYHADSLDHTISAYQFDVARGIASGRQIFARTPEGTLPDGSTVDNQGGVWNAQWGAGQVVRYSADGRKSLAIDLPVSQVTSVAFGGQELDLLFVTSARIGLSAERLADEPMAGGLLVYRTGFTGLPASRFGK
jgi:sugar lactone lactonase YvrE